MKVIYSQTLMAVVMIIGGIFMANHDGNCKGLYKAYSSKDAEINLTMDYPSDWQFSEHRGSYGSYAQVQFYGAVKGNFAPSFIMTVERSSKATFSPLTIDGLADDLIKKRMKFKDAQVVSKTETELLGLPAVEITMTYSQPDKLRSLDAKLVPFKERAVVFQRDDKFYTLRYVNPEQEFASFEEDFLHCIETLRIKG